MSAERPSNNWEGFGRLNPESGKLYEQINQVLCSGNFRHLERVALTARNTQDRSASPNISCTIDSSTFTWGFNNVVFEAVFSDGVQWIVRVEHQPSGLSSLETPDRDMASEVAMMKTVKERTNIPVPRVFAHNSSSSNDFGFPYILMEFLHGRILDRSLALHVPSMHIPKVAKQMADILFQLQNLTFDRLGRIWCGEDCNASPEIIPVNPEGADTSSDLSPRTSLEWFFLHRRQQNRLALEAHPHDPDWITSCWILKTAMAFFVIDDRVGGQFPLCHLDLHYGNLLFDDDYNLTGVIDWSQAQTVPLERLAVSPEFITFPAATEEVNTAVVNFRDLTSRYLREAEEAKHLASIDGRDTIQTRLSSFFGTRRAEITHRCTYTFGHRALWDGKLVAKLIYGDAIKWEQLVAAYGCTPIF